MNKLLKNWNLMRIIRLALGVIIMIQGVQTKEWIFVVLGGLFSIMPLLNIGCCSTGTCNTPQRKNSGKVEDIHFEEVK